jgi:hypothetical protein
MYRRLVVPEIRSIDPSSRHCLQSGSVNYTTFNAHLGTRCSSDRTGCSHLCFGRDERNSISRSNCTGRTHCVVSLDINEKTDQFLYFLS